MIYSTPLYPFFLLFMLLTYWLFLKTPKARLGFLAAGSFGFLAWRQPAGTLGVAALSLFVYFAGRDLRTARPRLKFYLAVIVPLSVLLFFKYASFFLQGFFEFSVVILPIGVSYYTFKHIHYLIESSRGNI